MANSADPDQLAFQKPTDLDLHCLQRQGISGFSRTKVKVRVWVSLCRNICIFSSPVQKYRKSYCTTPDVGTGADDTGSVNKNVKVLRERF